ncbi:hypothetical protein Y032_0039g11 [Ancylostoma ceylanicum]|uniref:Secreted protein n=1 Tax=Ancylostoma ceylanicum TaxID=53326 RepID=A0A016UJG6_9BILA|nr:hypothetical protein Y032_0039g11 [Ancylostoma ceylanicum]
MHILLSFLSFFFFSSILHPGGSVPFPHPPPIESEGFRQARSKSEDRVRLFLRVFYPCFTGNINRNCLSVLMAAPHHSLRGVRQEEP